MLQNKARPHPGKRLMGRLFGKDRISPARRALLLRSLLEVVRVRIMLTAVGYKNIPQIAPAHPAAARYAPNEIASAVVRVARLVPGATCLTQAVAARKILALNGHASIIRVGVKPDKSSRFMAHAWVLVENKIVLGGDEKSLADFSVLTELSGPSTE